MARNDESGVMRRTRDALFVGACLVAFLVIAACVIYVVVRMV